MLAALADYSWKESKVCHERLLYEYERIFLLAWVFGYFGCRKVVLQLAPVVEVHN